VRRRCGLLLWLIVEARRIEVLSGRLGARGRLGAMLAFGFAFVLLMWPLLWLVVGYIRYLITGQTFGT
jgi:hypothetical protein